MKIYFAGSIRAGREDRDLYAQIIQLLRSHGEVLTEHVSDGTLTTMGSHGEPVDIYNKDMSWLTAADKVVAEVTQPSLGVGYELAQAEFMKKPVLCLYRETPGRRLSAMILGSQHFKIHTYQKPEELSNVFAEFLQKI